MATKYKIRSKVVPYPGEPGVGPRRKAGAWRGEERSRKFAAANYLRLDAWYFAYVEKKQAAVIAKKHLPAPSLTPARAAAGGRQAGATKKAGFSSIRVTVTLGKSKWKTSIFPDKHSGAYVLPLKKQIRRAENIDAGDTVSFTLEI